MRKEGTIVRWDTAKGFGFIRSPSLAQDVFVHVRDYRPSGGEAPRDGLRVTFDDIHVGGKGPRAVAVQPVAGPRESPPASRATRRTPPARPASRRHVPRPRRLPTSGAWFALPLMAAYAVALVWMVWARLAPWWVLSVSAGLNLATFFAYWQDKYAAQQRRWRIAEATLHLWSLAGGWAGAWCAQQVLRHKSVKASFRDRYWVTVVVHCMGVAGVCWFLRPAG